MYVHVHTVRCEVLMPLIWYMYIYRMYTVRTGSTTLLAPNSNAIGAYCSQILSLALQSNLVAALDPPILNGEDAPSIEAERAGADVGDAGARGDGFGS